MEAQAIPMDIERQQRLMLRGIANIQVLASRALGSRLNTDFEALEKSNSEFKDFVRKNVLAPEILDYIQRIPTIVYGASEPGLVGIMFMPTWSLFFGNHGKASGRTIRQGQEVKDHYTNLEILVGMMEEE